MLQVIVLGVDSPIGLAVVRDLGRAGFSVTALGSKSDAVGLVSKYCSAPFVRKRDPVELIEQLLSLANHGETKPCLIAIGESDIALLNKYRHRLSSKMTLLFETEEQMSIVLDKAKTQKIADTLGISTPKFWTIENINDLDVLENTFLFPIILKWTNPHRVSAALNSAQLPLHKIEYCRDLKELREKLSLYCVIGEFPMIQQYYSGHGLGQFFLCKNGESLMQFQHERVHEWPPEGGSASLCRTIHNLEHMQCTELSKSLLRTLSWNGVAMVEYRYDSTAGTYVLMEINGRFWGSTALSVAAGANFASHLVQAFGLSLPITQPKILQRHCRYMIPETKRLVRILFQPQLILDPIIKFNKLKTILHFFGYFFHPQCRYYVFSIDDPKPFLADAKQALWKALLLLIPSIGSLKIK